MDYTRQLGLLPEGSIPSITIIGCGGIGSPTAIALAMMGARYVQLVDDDTIESHNQPNQLLGAYDLNRFHRRNSSIGVHKAEQLAKLMNFFGDVTPDFTIFRFNEDVRSTPIVISGVDSFTSRKEIWKILMEQTPMPELYIDGRMAAQAGFVYAIDPRMPSQQAQYEATLFDDKDALQEPCTARSIIYNTFALASVICSHVRRFAVGLPVPFEINIDTLNWVTYNSDFQRKAAASID